MNVFGIGLPEMALIFILALLIFGPKKLPEIGRSLGKAIRGFQDASKEFESEFKREAEQLEKAVKEPMEAKLEEPEQPALSPASKTLDTTEVTPVEAEVVASSEEVKS
jgi:sec-independent protein translocase protein TatA